MKKLIVLSLTTLVVACGGGDSKPTGQNTNTTQGSNDSNTVANNTDSNTNSDTYADGLTKTGQMGKVQVMLANANPAPPDVGENSWVIEVMDADGQPIDGVTVTVSPYMPAHGHGTTPADYTGVTADGGLTEVGPFDLFMPGTWETTVKVEGTVDDVATFTFDLEG